MMRLSKQKWQREVEKLISDLNNSVPSTTNYQYCMGRFFSHLVNETSFSDNTIRIRYMCLSTLIKWLETEADIHDLKLVNKLVLRQYLVYCKETRGQQGSMLKCSKVALRNFFSFLYNSEILPSNSAKSLQIPTRMNIKSIPILEYFEIAALINASKSELERLTSSRDGRLNNDRRIFSAKRNIAMFYVLCSTGIRTQEVCLITLSDIDLDKGIININGKGNNVFLKRYRSVYIDIPDVLDTIKSYLAIRSQSKTQALFCSWDGFPLQSAAIISVVKNIAREANIQRKEIGNNKYVYLLFLQKSF